MIKFLVVLAAAIAAAVALGWVDPVATALVLGSLAMIGAAIAFGANALDPEAVRRRRLRAEMRARVARFSREDLR